MRILCLHGMGTNAEIFQQQTGKPPDTTTGISSLTFKASLRELLPANYVFVFIDGPETCEPAPGVSHVFPGPYRRWYSTPTTTKVTAVHSYITEIIDREGGFDGVMGFSQVSCRPSSPLCARETPCP